MQSKSPAVVILSKELREELHRLVQLRCTWFFLLFQREGIFAVRFLNGNGIADRRGISRDVFHAYLRVDLDLKFRRMVFFFDRVLHHHNGDGAALSSCIDHVILPPFSPEWS